MVRTGYRTLTDADFNALREARAANPELVSEKLAERVRRPIIRGDGKLLLIAADHPARGALGVGDDPLAMADRYDLLDRLALVLSRPGVNGVLGTPDIIEDLALLGLLDDKIVVGSMNRGGLRGAAFEMDDRFTAYDVDGIVASGLDFAKTLIRVNLSDAGTVATLESNAHAVTAAVAARVPILLEPFTSKWQDGKIVNDLSTEAVVNSVAITSALGSRSSYTWLKLPVVDGMEQVMAATTMPTLLLGGEPKADAAKTFANWAEALALPGVRGLIVGRALLYPADGDVTAAVDIAAGLVHSA